MSSTEPDQSPGFEDVRGSAIRPHGGWVALAVLLVGAGMLALTGVPGGQQRVKQRKARGGESIAPTGRASTDRSLFVWDGAIASDPAARDQLLDFALERGIDQLFVDASPVGYGQSGATSDYAALVGEAHAAGLFVVAVGGFPWWGVSDTAGLPNQPTGHGEGWAYYAAIAASGVPFDGILDDTEPYLAAPDDWAARTDERAQDYLDFLRGVEARIGGLRLFATIPFWYDQDPAYDLALDGSAASRTLNAYVADIADVTVVMAYRDVAAGPDGILEHTAGELAAGPTLIAVETVGLGPDPVSDKLSFWEEGQAHLEAELDVIAKTLRRNGNLAGFAIHDEPAYRLLGP